MTIEELYNSAYKCASGNCNCCTRLKSTSTWECKQSVLKDTVTLLENLIDDVGVGDCDIRDIKLPY